MLEEKRFLCCRVGFQPLFNDLFFVALFQEIESMIVGRDREVERYTDGQMYRQTSSESFS